MAVLVASKTVAAKYAGRNFSNLSYKSWLGIRQATQAGWRKQQSQQLGNSLGSSVASFGQNEDEFEKARQQMMRSDGRDFLEESTIAEAARQEREREVLKEARSGLSQNSGSQASMLYGSDTRGELASDDKVLHRQRCAVFTCEGILEQADSECVVCECPRSELCVCGDCAQPYNPNRHKKCNTAGCGRLFSHHPHYYKTMQKPSRSLADSDKDAEKMTLEKLKKKVESIRWRRVLMDPRGTPSLRLATETQPVEVVDILCRVSTTAAEDITFNQPPIADYTAAMTHDMITKSSKALYGRASKGRLSMWQFMPMEGAWECKLVLQ